MHIIHHTQDDAQGSAPVELQLATHSGQGMLMMCKNNKGTAIAPVTTLL